ncbi:MAG: TonB-dependent receptor [Myxococcota bacterium]
MVVALAAWAADPPVEVVVVEAPDVSVEEASPASVTVIEVDERIPEGADLGAVVGQASGVAVTRLGGLGDFASVSIRGSTGRQVSVFLDGVPLNPDGVGTVDLSELPLRAFERVEVWRGNAPVGMGGTAMGGAVNLVTGEGEATALAGSAGSWTTARIRGLASRHTPFGNVWAAGQYLSTLGDYVYLDDRGTRFEPDDDVRLVRGNNDTRVGSGNARVRVERDRWRLTVLDAVLARDEGVPGFIGLPTDQVRYGAVQNLGVVQLDVSGTVPLRARVHGRHRAETLTDAGQELGTGTVRTRTTSVGLDLQSAYAGAPWWRVDAAASAALDVFGSDASRTVLRAHLGGTAWAARRRVMIAPVVSAVRLDSRGASEASNGAVLPRLGVLWSPGGVVSVRANAGLYFRPPDPTELFGNRGALAGRPDLRPEHGSQVDLGVRLATEPAVLEVGGFQSTSTDLIVYVQNAQQVAVPTNLGRTVVRGVEAALTVRGLSWLDVQTNLTAMQSVNLAEPYVGNDLPRIPRVQLDQRTAYVRERFRFGHTFSLTDGVYTDAANIHRQAARPIHGLFARVPLGGDFTLDVDVLNLLDTRTQRVRANPLDPASVRVDTAIADFVGYPLPGRTLLLTVRFEEVP